VLSPGFASYHCKCMAQTVEIYIRLLHEGTECSRPTKALDLGNGLFKVLPTTKSIPAMRSGSFPLTQSCAPRFRRSGGKEFRLAVAADSK